MKVIQNTNEALYKDTQQLGLAEQLVRLNRLTSFKKFCELKLCPVIVARLMTKLSR